MPTITSSLPPAAPQPPEASLDDDALWTALRLWSRRAIDQALAATSARPRRRGLMVALSAERRLDHAFWMAAEEARRLARVTSNSRVLRTEHPRFQEVLRYVVESRTGSGPRFGPGYDGERQLVRSLLRHALLARMLALAGSDDAPARSRASAAVSVGLILISAADGFDTLETPEISKANRLARDPAIDPSVRAFLIDAVHSASPPGDRDGEVARLKEAARLLRHFRADPARRVPAPRSVRRLRRLSARSPTGTTKGCLRPEFVTDTPRPSTFTVVDGDVLAVHVDASSRPVRLVFSNGKHRRDAVRLGTRVGRLLLALLVHRRARCDDVGTLRRARRALRTALEQRPVSIQRAGTELHLRGECWVSTALFDARPVGADSSS